MVQRVVQFPDAPVGRREEPQGEKIGQRYFDKPVVLTVVIEPSSLQPNQQPAIFCFDETKRTWIEAGGKVTGNEISAELDDVAKFAVFVVDNEKVKPTLETDFSDIAGNWAESNIKYASSIGLVKGYADGIFKPGKTATRAEFAVMLMNALKLPQADGEPAFTDRAQIGSWAREEVAQALGAGIIKGYMDGSFRPNVEIARTERVYCGSLLHQRYPNSKIQTASSISDKR
ncbi:S-layer homology domain-containing protein [Paenibacillus sepulcri]|uniref:S-layer homology domain-containing protein n=1 Tax=Paenibacillus sepulcri TaxID=359917 RepID=UPI001AE95158